MDFVLPSWQFDIILTCIYIAGALIYGYAIYHLFWKSGKPLFEKYTWLLFIIIFPGIGLLFYYATMRPRKKLDKQDSDIAKYLSK